MSKEILTRSNNISREYCCSIVRVGEVVPIEGSDFLGKTIVDGFQIVVRKDMVKEGDIMFYASNESELNEKFLSVNNQFEDYKLNSNYESEVLPRLKAIEDCKAWINSYDTSVSDPVKDVQLAVKQEQIRILEEELKTLRGFFNKNGRVKMITLRKCPSLGYLFTIDSMQKYCPKIKDVDLASIVDDETRGKVLDVLEKVIPKLVCACLMAYDKAQGKTAGEYKATVDFKEYANPSFESQVETVGKAKTQGVMSIESVVEELYGDSKTDEWKAEEVKRIKNEQGITELEEPSMI